MDAEKLALVDCDQDVRPYLDQLLPKIETLIKETVDANYQGERVLQLLRLERADNFYRGIQNIAPTMDPGTGAITWTAFGPTGQSKDENGSRSLDYNPRMTKSYGDKFVAVLGQRPFHNCTADAGDPTSAIDRSGARQVNLLIQMLGGQLPLKILNLRLFYYLYKTGTTFGFARPVTDGDKFGFDEVPNLVPQQQCLNPQCGAMSPMSPGDTNGPPQCPQCGASTATVPAPDPTNPTKKYPKTSVMLDLLNGYTTTTPFNVVELNESPWIVSKSEKDRGIILKGFPQARKIVGMGTGSGIAGDHADATGATVRAAAQSQTGTIRSRNLNMWTDARIWLDSSRLQLIDDDKVRALALQLYSEGVYVVQIEGRTVAIHKEDYRKRFSSCLPSMADYLFTDGGCWGMLGLEDAWSNLLNIMMETLETGIPTFITNPEYVNADELNRARYSPNRFTEAIAKYGENIQSSWGAMIPASRYPDQLPQSFEIIDAQIQNILGLLPQVYGQMPGNLTLGQARMMLNQGLMQLGTVSELATNFWEQSWTNLVKMYVQVAGTNPQFKGETIDLDLIKNSAWTIKGDTAIPRSFAERVEALRELLSQTPQLAQALKIGSPANLGRLRDYLDLPDFEDPDADAMEALKEIIDQLWQAAPQDSPPGPPDPMSGIPGPPGPPQPSIPFDSLVFDPQMAIDLCRAALTDNLGQQRQMSPGYQNVRAFLQAAQQAATPPPPPPPPPKLTISGKLDPFTPEQEGALLNDFGITVPPPHPGAVQARAQQKQADQQQGQDPNGPQLKGPPSPPGMPPPDQMLGPGTPGMGQPSPGMVQ
jgi:hypothetical protein